METTYPTRKYWSVSLKDDHVERNQYHVKQFYSTLCTQKTLKYKNISDVLNSTVIIKINKKIKCKKKKKKKKIKKIIQGKNISI